MPTEARQWSRFRTRRRKGKGNDDHPGGDVYIDGETLRRALEGSAASLDLNTVDPDRLLVRRYAVKSGQRSAKIVIEVRRAEDVREEDRPPNMRRCLGSECPHHDGIAKGRAGCCAPGRKGDPLPCEDRETAGKAPSSPSDGEGMGWSARAGDLHDEPPEGP